MPHPPPLKLFWLAALLLAFQPTTAVGQLAGLPSTADAWQPADRPYSFAFPRDHAAHPDYRIEWWYYTGNLHTADGRPFGYQLTFFRTGVVRQPASASVWAVRDLYVAHFAVSDLAGGAFHFFQRVGRRGVGWNGADTQTYHVWHGDWSAQLTAGDVHQLAAVDGDCRLQLRLEPRKPPVLHGANGFSRKGPSSGNASHYYSLTRLQTAGTLTVAGRPLDVSGWSWMDHEFSSSFLEKGQGGWDWLSLELDDGRELMLYQIRRADGTPDPYSAGTLVAADGTATPLGSAECTLQPGRRWTSPDTGAAYPVQWTLRLPQRQGQLAVASALDNQEMNTTASNGFPYWEGSITVQGTLAGHKVHGRGYLEMTGYSPSGKPAGQLPQ